MERRVDRGGVVVQMGIMQGGGGHKKLLNTAVACLGRLVASIEDHDLVGPEVELGG